MKVLGKAKNLSLCFAKAKASERTATEGRQENHATKLVCISISARNNNKMVLQHKIKEIIKFQTSFEKHSQSFAKAKAYRGTEEEVREAKHNR